MWFLTKILRHKDVFKSNPSQAFRFDQLLFTKNPYSLFLKYSLHIRIKTILLHRQAGATSSCESPRFGRKQG